ncbi:YraN family protein [Variibacter gotjawalensis]|nr:YraN family protein [Variibacter gotjawalensis]
MIQPGAIKAQAEKERLAAKAATEKPSRAKKEKPEPKPEKQAAFRLGLSAESRAASLLLAKGYRIAFRRWRTPHGEVDVVVRRGKTLVFVEVKARETRDDAAFSVTPKQKKRIIGGAEFWLMKNPHDANCFIRFDVVLVTPSGPPQHIENAFDASS